MASDRKPMKFITSSTFQKADNIEIYLKKLSDFLLLRDENPHHSNLTILNSEYKFPVFVSEVSGTLIINGKPWINIIFYSWSKAYLIYRNEFLLFLNVNKYKQNTSCDILYNSVILIPVIPSDISRMTRTHTRISD